MAQTLRGVGWRIVPLALVATMMTLPGSCPAHADTWSSGQVITYTQQDFAAGGSAANILSSNFLSVYPSALVFVGKPVTGFTMAFDSAGAIETYLPAAGEDGPLDSNLFNPPTSSAGVFGGDVLALQLNVDFSGAGITLGSSGVPFGNLLIENYAVFPAFDGMTVRQILADANTDLAGRDSGFSIGELVDIVPTLNIAFDGGTPSVFAQDNLVAPNGTTGGGGNAVPEPSSLLLLGSGMLGLAILCHRRTAALNTNKRVERLALLALLVTLSCSSRVDADTWSAGQVVSYTQNDWAAGGSAASILGTNFISVYPGAVVLIGEATGGNSAAFDNAGSIESFLPASGPTGNPFESNYFDPSSTSAGSFAGDVLALQLDVDFSDAGVTSGSLNVAFGDLVLENFDPSLNGLTVRQLLAEANIDLGSGTSPHTIFDLEGVIPSLTDAFDRGNPSTFAQTSLVAPNGTAGGGGNTVPEPSSLFLLGSGMLGLAILRLD